MKWSRADKLTLASTVIAALGFLLVVLQIRMATTELRGQFLSQLHGRAFASQAIADVYRKIEYGLLEYNDDFHNSEDQKALVELLSFLELLGQLENLNLLKFSDVSEIFGYYIIRVHKNAEVAKYRKFLDEWQKETGMASAAISFPNFDRLAKRILAESPVP